jgi:hypothetical protein
MHTVIAENYQFLKNHMRNIHLKKKKKKKKKNKKIKKRKKRKKVVKSGKKQGSQNPCPRILAISDGLN